MSDRKWLWINFDGAIPHFVCAGLSKSLINDLKNRGCPVDKQEECTDMNIDMPGMICTDRPWETLPFMGADIDIPSEDVASFILKLSELKERVFDDGTPYYKLHGFCRCIVFTPAQRVAFLDLLKSRVQEAEKRATLFWADRKPPSQVLREAAASVNNIPIEEVPNLGGNKVDRFVLLGKGKDKGIN